MTAASRPARSLLAAALALAAAPASAGDVFSSTVFFGDSLTDAGTFRPAYPTQRHESKITDDTNCGQIEVE